MTYAITAPGNIPRITQSGVDTALAGIDTMIAAVAAVAVLTPYVVGDIRKPPAANGMWYRCSTLGTTAAVAPLYDPVSGSATTDGTAVFTAFLAPTSSLNGDLRTYSFPVVDFEIAGTLTIANPAIQTYVCRLLYTTGACNYTSGTFATGVVPLTAGVHFTTCFKGPNNYAEQSTWDGAWSIRGGCFVMGAAVKPDGAGVKRFYNVRMISSSEWGGQSIRWRSFASNIQFLNSCETYDIGIDCFNIPSAVSIKSFGSEYVLQYVGSQFGGTDALMTISALSNQNGTYDFDNYAGGWIEIYDCAKGAALNVVCQQNLARHCVPLFQNLNFTVTNLTGVAQNDVRYSTTDAPTNSPTTTITTLGNLKTWDFRNPLTLTGITAGGGLVSSVPCLKVWWGLANTQNLRYPASTATYFFCGYAIRKLSKAVVLGSDIAQAIGVAGESATNLTLTEAQAAALTGIALAPSGQATGTATITLASTTMELWQYFRQWIATNYATRDDTWLPSSGVLSLGAWDLTSAVVISAASGFNTLSTTGTISSTLTSGGAYTYVNGSLTLPLTLPALAAGTMNIGAAATFAFATATSTVSMTPTVPSTYIFTGAHTGTLSLRNAAVHAITVTVPLGTVTSTAGNTGGVITVNNPNVVTQVLRPNIINGSNWVIRNVTTATEIGSGTTSGGTGIDVSFIKGTHYNSGNVLELRIGYCVALAARLTITEQMTMSNFDAVNSAPTTQALHTVYNELAINGSAVTGFVADYANNEVDINIAADFLGQNFMAWWVFTESTLNGLRNFLGKYTLIDVGNIRNDTANGIVLFDNITITNIKQIDNVRIFRSDVGYPVKNPSAGGGSIDINWRNPVVVTGMTDNSAATALAVWSTAVPGAFAAGTAGITLPAMNTAVNANSLAAAAPAANWALAMGSGHTAKQAVDVLTAVAAGKVSGGAGAPVFRSIDDARNVVAGVADAQGNRTVSTITAV